MEDLHLTRIAQQDLPGLRQWLKRLHDMANRMLENVQYSEHDHFGFMALCFLSKQEDHARSILTLGEARDVQLIVRSMLEGLFQLLWAANDPDTRSLRWRTFASVHDWRIMQAEIAAGEPVDEARRTVIAEQLGQYGDQFLTRKAREARRKGDPDPNDPYCDNWTGQTVRQISESVQGDLLYLELYKPFSDWQHWSPGGIGNAVVREKGKVAYSSESVVDAATALQTAFQCLLQTLELTDQHLGRGFAARIAKLEQGYIDWHQRQHAPGMGTAAEGTIEAACIVGAMLYRCLYCLLVVFREGA